MRSRPRQLLIFVLALTASFAMSAHPARVASASGAFSCQPGFYQVLSGHLKILNPLTGVYSDIGADGDDYNAIGYNPVDNYVYGWGSGGALNDIVVKVDSSGTVTTMGNAGLGTQNYVSADFDDQGFLWMRHDNLTLAKVNVSANPATATLVTLTSDTSSTFTGVDMGWIGNVMYSVDGDLLKRADLTTLKVTSATITDLNSPVGKTFVTSGSTGGVVNNAFGAVFSNRSDELYISQNSTGYIYRITDFTTANPKATFVVTASVTNNNDGAACKKAVSPFDLPSAVDDSFSITHSSTLTVPALTGIFANDDATSPVLVTNSSPTTGTLTVNQDGSFTYVPQAGYVGAVTFTYTAQDRWGRNTASATVTINVSAPATTTSVSTTTTTVAVAAAALTTRAATEPESIPDTGQGSAPLLALSVVLVALGLAARFTAAQRRNRA
jgi:hypothetical protein